MNISKITSILGWQGSTISSPCHSFAFILNTSFHIFFGSLFQFLIFQCLRCSSSLKRPWGLQVLSFVSHFLLKLFFFNPLRLFTVVVLALSTLFRFLSLSLSPPHLSLCQPEVNAILFSSACKKAGGTFVSYYSLKIETKTKLPFKTKWSRNNQTRFLAINKRSIFEAFM